MNKPATNYLILVLSILVLQGCVGARTFHEVARAGDTVALAAGWKHYFSRDNITVTITPSSGSPIVYLPNDPAVRAVVNLYPDPLSSLLVSPKIGQDLTPSARTYASVVSNNYTNQDPDWWQTTVFVDLPDYLPSGTATISITNPQGESASPIVDIVDGAGRSNTFEATTGPTNEYQLASMERVGNYVVRFSGSTIPYAIQVDMVHDPDKAHGGTGVAYVINPRGDIKNVTWSDTGSNLRVILTPAKGAVLSNMFNYKFYVAGGVKNLSVLNIKAVDIDGNPVSGVTASVD
jgi:hypothetical protein